MQVLVLGKRICLRPIGFVETDAVGDEVKDRTRLSRVVVDSSLVPALEGIEGFSHVYVLFWLDRITRNQRKTRRVHPRGRKDLPQVGVFTARTNLRPNPIGLTLVELISVEENVLTVRGLDAFNGTPVLDLKTHDMWDTAKNTRVPQWWTTLEKEKAPKTE